MTLSACQIPCLLLYLSLALWNVRYICSHTCLQCTMSMLTVLRRTCARSGRVYLIYHVKRWWRHQRRTLLWRRYPENMLWGAGDTCVVTMSNESSSCVYLLQISIQLSLMVLIFIYIYIYMWMFIWSKHTTMTMLHYI